MKTLAKLKTPVGKAAQGANVGHIPCGVIIALVIYNP